MRETLTLQASLEARQFSKIPCLPTCDAGAVKPHGYSPIMGKSGLGGLGRLSADGVIGVLGVLTCRYVGTA